METNIDSQLSFELQEMYLENKEWLSTMLFLVDEMRFFQQIFKKASSAPKSQVSVIDQKLVGLEKRRSQLNILLTTRKAQLEAFLKDQSTVIPLAFINDDAAIVVEIKSLLNIDKEVKQEIFALIEQLPASPSSVLKKQTYFIL